MRVLLATDHPEPPAVELVRGALEARSARVHSWYPTRSLRPSHPTLALGDGELTSVDGLDLRSFDAVWNRLPLVRDPSREDLEPEVRAACRRVTEALIAGVFERVRGLQLDPFWVTRRAENKLFQLDCARAAGLEIPPTLVTSDVRAVRAFAERWPAAITKMVVHWVGSESESGAGDDRDAGPARVFTSRLDCDDPSALAGLELCPMIFQAEVPKERELRVTVVGDQLFAAAVDTSHAAGGGLDWRRDQDPLIDTWTRCELPEGVRASLLGLMDRLDLDYGCADFIHTPDGRLVFLEVNVLGEFAFLEHQLGLGIPGAVADLLTGRVPRRRRRR